MVVSLALAIAAHGQARLFEEGLCLRAKPIPGAKDALRKLKEMGYRYVRRPILHQEYCVDASRAWLSLRLEGNVNAN